MNHATPRFPLRFVRRRAVAGIAIAAGAVACGVRAQGGAAGSYLRPPAAAAHTAMGGAVGAHASYLCSWANPALLATVERRHVAAGAGYRALGRLEGCLAYEARIPPRMGLGLSVLYRGDPHLDDLHDEDENLLEPAAYTTMTTKIGTGYRLSPRTAVGMNVSVFYQRMPTGTDDGKATTSSITEIGGFDFGILYRISGRLQGAVALKNIAAAMNWDIPSVYLMETEVSNRVPPVLTAGLRSRPGKKEAALTVEADIHALNGDLAIRDHAYVQAHAGVEWHYRPAVVLRAGVRDLYCARSLFSDFDRWLERFRPAVSAGLGFDCSRVHPGCIINYSVTVQKIWAGIDQQVDAVYEF